MIRALIFDFDGLILDTEMPDYDSWQSVFARYDKSLPIQMWGQIVGGTGASDFDPHNYLESLIGQSLDREEIWISRRQHYLESVSQQPILPGILDYFEQAEAAQLKLAVASSSPENWVRGHLTRLGIVERFHTIKTADDVVKTKPAPELFLTVLDEFNIQADEAIVFEDSPNGVLAAAAAGIAVVAIPNPLTAQLEFEQANQQLTSLAELSLSELIEKLKI